MIETDRLLLRRWQASDRGPFAAMGADPEVMAHFPGLMTRAESDALIDRVEAHFDACGYGMWAMERRSDRAFIGFTGLQDVNFVSPIDGDIEIGWRLARSAWGLGLAHEAAATCLEWSWANTDAERIVAMTVTANVRSQGLMQRLGLQRRTDLDFDHPRVVDGNPLRPHIVYSIDRA